jgi:hydrogenase maturation protein HypF
VRGIVQGVGFRPFVYNLAQANHLTGFVLNSSSGVTIELEGSDEQITAFLKVLRSEPPALAQIEEILVDDLTPSGGASFEIRQSQTEEDEFVLVSPDVATCTQCLREVFDPGDRRQAYPFTNCTNCGPRYTIIYDIPYDRPKTTMWRFPMCPACEAEYHDPGNRRFHAQPNACPVCGPAVILVKAGTVFPTADDYKNGGPSITHIRQARAELRAGAIVAVKGLGGFQLACDAENDTAVQQLRQRKKRSDKPFALMVRDLDAAEKIAFIADPDRQLLMSPERPIVIVPRRQGSRISRGVAPRNETIGIMVANTPLHSLLFGDHAGGEPEFNALVMTSGNISEEPIVVSNQKAWKQLAQVADWFLFHNRDIYMRVDDSAARTFSGAPMVLRRSRGYAPRPIDIGMELAPILACGGELKNSLCLTKKHYAILSQHIGDLSNYETLEFFKETLANLKRLFRAEPEYVAHDLHPLYLSSRFAAALPLPRFPIQHHHAHIASCMAEHHLRGRVIGVAMDGTGYGTDGKIWGGEFLSADYHSFNRMAHFRYVPLPGGDAAVRQVWRPALSWLKEAFGNEYPDSLPFLQLVPERDVRVVSGMITRGLNSVLTSSCGRLFDAVASLIGLRQEVTFEGQAAIELEMIARPEIEDCYSFEIEDRTPAQIDFRPMIREIVRDLADGAFKSDVKTVVASRFHNTIAAVIGKVCQQIRKNERLNRVCLSGGTFQNVFLLQRSVSLLRRHGLEVFIHSQVPPNDGGIALGQAVIAHHILKTGA